MGARATVKTKEYFDIVAHKLGFDLQLLEDGKKFIYRAEDEEKNIRENVRIYELNLERNKQRLEEIEKEKNSQIVKPC